MFRCRPSSAWGVPRCAFHSRARILRDLSHNLADAGDQVGLDAAGSGQEGDEVAEQLVVGEQRQRAFQ